MGLLEKKPIIIYNVLVYVFKVSLNKSLIKSSMNIYSDIDLFNEIISDFSIGFLPTKMAIETFVLICIIKRLNQYLSQKE